MIPIWWGNYPIRKGVLHWIKIRFCKSTTNRVRFSRTQIYLIITKFFTKKLFKKFHLPINKYGRLITNIIV